MRSKELFYRAMAAAMGVSLAAGSVFPAAASEQTTLLEEKSEAAVSVDEQSEEPDEEADNIHADSSEMPEKDENVYVSLNDDGGVAGVYVVNEYDLDEDTELTDYGDYVQVENLTSDVRMTLENGVVTVNASKGKFYYKGILEDKSIPWDISITYLLDGKKITTDELAGKSGSLKILLEVKENPESVEGFFENYLMQATVTLNTEKCSSIKAEGATEANNGKNRQLLYNIMAGQEKKVEITAEVTEFEMDAITFQAVPMSFDLDSDSFDKEALYEKTDEIKEAAVEFDDGANDLQEGVGELADGVAELADGSSDLKDGASELKSGTGDLLSGANELAGGANTLVSGLNQAKSGSNSLKNGIETLAEGIEEMGTGAEALQLGLTQLTELSPELVSGSAEVLTALQAIQASLTNITVGTDQMQLLLDSSAQILTGIQNAEAGAQQVSQGLGAIQENKEQITYLETENTNAAAYLSSMASMASVLYAANKDTVDGYAAAAGVTDVNAVINNVVNIAGLLGQNNGTLEQLLYGVDQAEAGAETLVGGLSSLEEQYQKFDEQIQGLPVLLNQMIVTQMEPLKNGIDQLTAQYEILNTGVITYTDAVAEIKAGYDSLYEGLLQASEGTESLVSGSKKLSSGTSSAASGAASLASGASALASGASSLNSGASELYDGTVELYDGVAELQNGVAELQDGAVKLKDGTTEFTDKTSDIDKQIDEEIDKVLDEIAGSDFEQMSFVSPENTNVGLVQFAIQTDPITVPEMEEEETEVQEKSLMDKVKKLFGK